MRIRVDAHIVAEMSHRACRTVAALDDADIGCGDGRGAGHQKMCGEHGCRQASHMILSSR
jgi:hypothetical protein